MSSFFVFTTTAKVTKASAARINAKIKAIDNTAEFVGPVSMPGNQIRGWIERPNDGNNSYNHVASRNNQMADIARKELGI